MNKTFKQAYQEEMVKLREMNFSEKREYIWAYYKYHIIAITIIFTMVGGIINDVWINPPPQSVLTIAWMGHFATEDQFDEIREVLSPVLVEDPDRETVQILSFRMTGDPSMDMAQHQRFSAMLTTRELDIAIGGFMHSEFEEAPDLLGMAPVWSFGELRPIMAAADVEVEHMLFYDDDEGVEVGFAVPIEGNAFFEGIGIITENQYLAMFINSERMEAVVQTIQKIWEMS